MVYCIICIHLFKTISIRSIHIYLLLYVLADSTNFYPFLDGTNDMVVYCYYRQNSYLL